jgi:hypothetical protein
LFVSPKDGVLSALKADKAGLADAWDLSRRAGADLGFLSRSEFDRLCGRALGENGENPNGLCSVTRRRLQNVVAAQQLFLIRDPMHSIR